VWIGVVVSGWRQRYRILHVGLGSNIFGAKPRRFARPTERRAHWQPGNAIRCWCNSPGVYVHKFTAVRHYSLTLAGAALRPDGNFRDGEPSTGRGTISTEKIGWIGGFLGPQKACSAAVSCSVTQALFLAWYNFGQRYEMPKGNASDGQRANGPRMDDQRTGHEGGRDLVVLSSSGVR
jgi:hypothetical protein